MRGLKAGVVAALLLAVFAFAGCGERELSKPPKIRYGRDACARCRMIVEDRRFACAAVSAERRFLKFDDIGCLAVYDKTEKGSLIRSWVPDAREDKWVERENAFFVYSEDLVTPMGYGFAAFADGKAAAAFAGENGGRLVDWDELFNLTDKQISEKGAVK